MNEEEIYELISEEIESSSTKKGLWTKAFSESEGDEQKTRALYIKYRFDQMNDVQPQVEEKVKIEEKRAVTNRNCFFCGKPNSNLLMIIGENKENFCSPKCYSRALIRKDSEGQKEHLESRCFYCKKDNANFYDYLPFRDRSEYFCNKTCFNKKLGGRVFGHETWFEKINDGDFGLAKAYWLFYFIPINNKNTNIWFLISSKKEVEKKKNIINIK